MKSKSLTAVIKNVRWSDLIDFLENEADFSSFTLTLVQYSHSTSCVFFETNRNADYCRKILSERFGNDVQF